jgi:hypothetical protein
MSDKNFKTIEMSSEQFAEMHHKVQRYFMIAFGKDLLVLRCRVEEHEDVVNAFKQGCINHFKLETAPHQMVFSSLVIRFIGDVKRPEFGDDLHPNLVAALNEVMEASEFICNHELGFAVNGILTISTFEREQSLKLMKHLASYLGTHIKSIKAKMFDDASCAFRLKLEGSGYNVKDVVEKFRLEEVLRPK